VSKSILAMMEEVAAFERSKGWVPNDNQFGTSLALLHSEISEALEAFRDGDWGSTVDGLFACFLRGLSLLYPIRG
jgi:hypothetical protein